MFSLDGLPVSTPAEGSGYGTLTRAASLGLHALALLGVVTVPLLLDQPLPEQAHATRAFLAEPISLAAPPPPPPPPAAARSVMRAVRAASASDTLVARIEVASDIVRDGGLDLGVEGDLPGGVEGGVPGGVAGGVVGGLPDAPLPPRAKPLRAGIDVQSPRKIRDVAPEYPDLARRANVQGVVILECVIDEHGRVQDAKVTKGIPLLDEAALAAVRQWRYAPSLLDGVPMPVLMTVTVTFQLFAGH